MTPINQSDMQKVTSDGKYALGKNGKPYKKKLTTVSDGNGGYSLVQKWHQVHYASYEKMKALKLLK